MLCSLLGSMPALRNDIIMPDDITIQAVINLAILRWGPEGFLKLAEYFVSCLIPLDPKSD